MIRTANLIDGSVGNIVNQDSLDSDLLGEAIDEVFVQNKY
jgi:hypothetical protein